MAISRRKRSASSALARPGCMTLRATRLRSRTSRARKTVAMPPRPSSRSMVYDPARARVSSSRIGSMLDVGSLQHLGRRCVQPVGPAQLIEELKEIVLHQPPTVTVAEVVHDPAPVHDEHAIS